MNSGDGTLLGSAVRIFNTDAVVWSGGCNQNSKQCSFSISKETLFEQPQVHVNVQGAVDSDEMNYEGRMGHSLIQLGNSIISFGGCRFKDECYNDLLI